MNIRNPRSIIIILVYTSLNAFVLFLSFQKVDQELPTKGTPKSMAPEFTLIENLDYFHLKKGVPQMSLAATQMRSQGETYAEFTQPRGVYNYQQKNETLRYQGAFGEYFKEKELLSLEGDVRILSSDSQYDAKELDYFFKQGLVVGRGGVKFEGEDLKTRDYFVINADSMRGFPERREAHFQGSVKGSMERKKKYEGKMKFESQKLDLDGIESKAHLEGDVVIERPSSQITAGKADIFFDNYNKSLKYFVLNDDVKVTETLKAPTGETTTRKAYSERLEGFGREQRMVLSGAPRVEQGTDVIKGYRITVRENAELIEVEDAMSEVQVKREEKAKKEQ